MPSKKINTVGIITKRNIGQHQKALKQLVRFLKKHKKKIVFDQNSAQCFKNEVGYHKTELLRKADLAIVMGGDGTLLKTARRMCRNKTLIFGVNFGNLGFLTESKREKMLEGLERIFKGKYHIDRRSLLRVTAYRKGKKLKTFIALNDAVINQGAFARLIKLDLKIDGRKLVNFEADGMIVATPTGSTAHSLSAGGAIIEPTIDAHVVTPICPSSLSMRPIVVPNNLALDATIETERHDDSAAIGLTIDGQDTLELKYGDRIKFRKSRRHLYLVRGSNRYYRMLRSKLGWGGHDD